MSNPYDTATERTSILGPTLRFKGELSADEDLVVHGQIEGTLGPAPRVTVGPEARVNANIHANIVVVEGTVRGDLHARASAVVKESATLDGNIEAPAVSILEGARFNGSVSMKTRAAGSGAAEETSSSADVRAAAR